MTREILFWCFAAALGVVAAVSIVAAFWRTSRFQSSDEQASQASRELLNEHLQNLEKELKAGLIDKKGYDESVEEIQQRALEEVALADSGSSASALDAGKWRSVMTGLCCTTVIGGAVALYMHLGSPNLINFVDLDSSHGIMNEDGTLAETVDRHSPDVMLAYLKENPTDERALVLYARMEVDRENWPAAAGAYDQAIKLGGKVAKDRRVKSEFAATLMSLRMPQHYEKARTVLRELISEDNNDLQAHQLFAIASLETAHWKDARLSLEHLMEKIPSSDPSYSSIGDAAAYAGRMERQEEERNAWIREQQEAAKKN